MSKFEEELEDMPVYFPEPIEKPLELKIKYHDSELIKLIQVEGSDWIDLRCAEDVEIEQFDSKLISLGISMEIPAGFEAHIAPRSGTFKNYGVIMTNGLGIIDQKFKGNGDIWGMNVWATRKTKINKNDRICQFRIIEKQPKLIFNEVDDMNNEDRGGWSSTGVK